MTSQSVLVRDSDGKEFRVVELSHWSKIRSADGEEFLVKWYGGSGDTLLYVGVNGPTFKVKS